jgi:hypothetical protein
MNLRLLAVVTALLGAPPAALAQDLAAIAEAIASELRSGPPDAIEVYAVDRFFSEWEPSARKADGSPMPVSGDGPLQLVADRIGEGLDLFRRALSNSPEFAASLADMFPRVMEQAKKDHKRIARLPLEDAARLYVLAQAMKGAAGIRVGNDDPRFCLFIDYCLEDDGPFGRP